MVVPILLYHHIGQPPKAGTPSRSNYVTIKSFEKQMRMLHRLGFKGVSLVEAMPYIKGEKTGRIAAITFDDGFLSVYRHAMPVLKSFGFTATNFFVPHRSGLDNAWDDPRAARETLMTVEQMRQWAAEGHEVGSHTLDHVHLTELESNEAKRQIGLSRQILEDQLGQKIRSFAYPYGDENTSVRDWVKQAGYDFAVTTRKGRAHGHEDAYTLPRHSVRRNDTLLHFLAKCLWR